MATKFEIGELVKAMENTQGLAKGQTYEVFDIFEIPVGIFGTVVEYTLKDSQNETIPGIRNGHLILESVGWA